MIVNMTVLASIFTGKINNWRDPTLLELNSNGLADYLPNETIKVSLLGNRTGCCRSTPSGRFDTDASLLQVFVREESSGTTEVFKRQRLFSILFDAVIAQSTLLTLKCKRRSRWLVAILRTQLFGQQGAL